MKTRNGFVTNSSSSSYIVCLGEVIDRKKAAAVFGEGSIKKGCDIFEWEIDVYWAGIYYPISRLDPTKEYLLISESGDWDDDNFEHNYDDVDLYWFSDSAQFAYENLKEENGVKEIYVGFGAGRDG